MSQFFFSNKMKKNREVIKQQLACNPLSFIVVQWRARFRSCYNSKVALFLESNFCGYSKWPKSQIQENKREREKVESDLNAEEAVCSCPCHVMENHLEALRGICIKCKWFFRAFFFGQCLLSLIIHC